MSKIKEKNIILHWNHWYKQKQIFQRENGYKKISEVKQTQ